MGELKDRVLKKIRTGIKNIRSGNVNGIPTPFVRFKQDYPLMKKGVSICVTASTKGAKSQLVNWLYVFHTLLYSFEHQDKVHIKIQYYTLEEQDEDLFERYMCFLLMAKYNKIVSLSDLNSDERELPSDIQEIIGSEEFSQLLDWYETHINFSDEADPEKIIGELEGILKKDGEIIYKEEEDEIGDTIKVPHKYKPHDPLLYFISIVDHVSLLKEMPGKDLRSTLVWFSREYNVRLRNFYKMIPICVQQQDFAGDRTSDKGANKGEPTRAGASDSKYLARDVSLMIGIYAPYHFKVPNYCGYDILKLKDRCRFLSILANRHGVIGGTIGLRFVGECAYFEELPRPDDAMIERYYEQADIVGKKIKIFHSLYKYLESFKITKKLTIGGHTAKQEHYLDLLSDNYKQLELNNQMPKTKKTFMIFKLLQRLFNFKNHD